jgi:hypothetical protein
MTRGDQAAVDERFAEILAEALVSAYKTEHEGAVVNADLKTNRAGSPHDLTGLAACDS